MTAAAPLPSPRRAASPYARRLARERGIPLQDLTGSGPGRRILAADVLAHGTPAQVRDPVPVTTPQAQAEPAPALREPVLAFSASVALVEFARLSAEAGRFGLVIAIEDVALRAASAAVRAVCPDLPQVMAIETEGKQIIAGRTEGLSIGTDRTLRLDATSAGADAADQSAAGTLLLLTSARIVPVGLPLLPGRAFRIVLVLDPNADRAQALLCADGRVLDAAKATALLEDFATRLEEPLVLLA